MKRTILLCHVFLPVLLTLSAFALRGQDIHFSQFGNSPLNLSPGLNGVFGGDMRFIANYRNQWRSVPVPYNTFSGSVENKFYTWRGRFDRYLTGALLLDYDRQGSLKLTSLQIGIPVGITMPVAGPNHFVSLSVTPAFGQRSFDTRSWSFDEQFIGGVYDPLNITGETAALYSTNLQYFDLSAGINYHWQATFKRSKADIGAGVHHLNRPNHNFWTSSRDVRLASRSALYGLGVLQLTHNFDLVLQAQYQLQRKYRDLVLGGGVRFLLNPNPYKELALQVSGFYRQRFNDAIIWQAEVFWKTFTLGISFDHNVSEFHLATEQRGGTEVSFSYRLYKPKFRTYCPTDY